MTGVLTDIVDADGFEIPDRDAVRAAIEEYRTTKADFADCVIGRLNQRAGCRDTLTFDRRLKPLPASRPSFKRIPGTRAFPYCE